MLSRHLPRLVSNYHRIVLCSFRTNAARKYSTEKTAKAQTGLSRRTQTDGQSAVTVGEKIASATKAASYTGVMLAGFGVVVAIVYGIYKEMFSSDSPQVMFSNAAEKYKEDPSVQKLLGSPIHVFGREHYNRTARRHCEYMLLQENGIKMVRLTFIMLGTNDKAQATVEFRENPKAGFFADKWEISYGALKSFRNGRVHVIEDHRRRHLSEG
ncbi:Mitochondrial import inner membrane translocase subunit Tim21 [Halotydeus destructor]|nr:Mitochondrial import inner membrane translocase subunit Tim21 [Halotydeus destructor]